MSNRVIIFDTTLRDGEQSPGATMNLQAKDSVWRVSWKASAWTSSKPVSRPPAWAT